MPLLFYLQVTLNWWFGLVVWGFEPLVLEGEIGNNNPGTGSFGLGW